MRRAPRVSLSRRLNSKRSGVSSLPVGRGRVRVEPLEGRQLMAADLISVNLTGTGSGNGDSGEASVSQDGRYVVFSSTSSDLVAGDNNGKSDIFLRDRTAGTTTL